MTERPKRAFRLPTDDATRPSEVSDELEFHLERKVEHLMRQGLSEAEARAEARNRFGDVERAKQRIVREGAAGMRRAAIWDRLRQDLHYATRQARRSPGFTALTLLTLTLAIGATTAIFSVVDGVLFRPLAFPESEELVAVWTDLTRRGGPADEWMNFPTYFDLKERSRALEAAAAWDGGGTTVTGAGEAARVTAASVSHEMFTQVLLVEPAAGRAFTALDDRPDADPTAIITDAFWRRALASSPDAVGATIGLNDVPHTIIGILPSSFEPPFLPDADVWLPIRVDRVNNYCGRGNACIRVIARMAEGVTLEEARAEATDIAAQLEPEFPEGNAEVGLNLVRLREDLVAEARPGLLVLLAAVACVLLIACVNVANLLLARGSTRASELVVRSALGAARSRITAQLLTEGALLALVGGALGVLLAYYAVQGLVAIAPAGTPRIEGVGLNLRVLAFAFGVTVFAGLLFATVPALRVARGSLEEGLRSGGRGAGDRASGLRGRGLLVSSQVAIGLVLLVSAGLLLQSFRNLRNQDLGFVPEGVLAVEIGLPGPRYPSAPDRLEFVTAVEARLASLPGVDAVGTTSWLPLTGAGTDTGFNIEGRTLEQRPVWIHRITQGYPQAMGMRLVAGRWFASGDDATAPRVVLVGSGFTQRHFLDETAVGRRVNLGSPDDPQWREIVGVAEDVRDFGIRESGRDQLYIPYAQSTTSGLTVAIRSSRGLAALGAEVRAAVAEVDPALALGRVDPMTAVVEASLGPERFVTLLTSLFAVLAFVLSVVGLYGVVSYGVSRRFREMGVRLALGAGGGDIEGLILKQSLGFVAIGLVVGVVAAVQVTRLMENLLFEVSPSDPRTFLAVATAFAVVGTAAAAIPARRASRVDPVRVLRAE